MPELKRLIPWGRVLVEGAVIVGSILLAFAIDAWWDGRIERGQESFYLGELDRELKAVRDEVRPFVRLAEVTRTRLGHIREQLKTENVVSPDTLSAALRLAVTTMSFAPLTAVHDDLVATGGLRLIRDDPLRLELARYRALLGYFREKVVASEEHRNQELIPFLNSVLPVYDLYDDPEHRSSSFLQGLERLRDDPGLDRQIASRMMTLEGVSLHGDRLLGQLDQLLEIVDGIGPSPSGPSSLDGRGPDAG